MRVDSRSSTRRIKFIQVNLNKQDIAHQTALQLAFESQTDILLLQEPYCPRNHQLGGYIGLQHSAYHLVTPEPTASFSNIRRKPRVLTYVRKASNLEFSPQYDLCTDPDIQVIEVVGREAYYIVNVYNERERLEGPDPSQRLGLTTVERKLQYLHLQKPALIVGDFNLHHTWWNSTANPARSSKAEILVDWLQQNTASLLVDPEETNLKGGTFVRSNLTTTSIIDLAFYTSFKTLVWSNWRYIDSTGSDHETIAFEAFDLNSGLRETLDQIQPTYNCKKANWEEFSNTLIARESSLLQAIESAISTENYEEVAYVLSNTIKEAADHAIPRKRVSEYSKPWWDEVLTYLRQTFNTAHRQYKKYKTADLEEAYKAARNTYFQAVRKKKEECWVNYLESLDLGDVYSVRRYTREKGLTKVPTIVYESNGTQEQASTFDGKCSAFLTTLFPKPTSSSTSSPTPSNSGSTPQNSASPGSKDTNTKTLEWEWPELSEAEVESAILTSSAKKAPGPDRINFDILQHAYKAIPLVFYKVYKVLFDQGIHPTQWKEGIGIVLAKPNKDDYTVPKAYRIIALLNCLGKTLEKIFASRLAYLANTTRNLLHDSQLGGRKQRSAIDAALLLLNEIQSRRKNSSTVTSTIFLDIKGAFDYVSKPRLLRILAKLGLPSNLRIWVSSFLSDRTIQLAFDGCIQPAPVSIDIGIPQGSPISPILFLLYVRDIVAEGEFQLSYIDDFCIAVTSNSARANCVRLESIVQRLFTLARNQAVQFDPGKTELIHFTTQRATLSESVQIGGITIEPKPVIRWLGIWFDSKLTFKPHIEKKAKSATAAFYGIQRLGNTQKGLSARAIRLLYVACVTPIADFGIQLWWKGIGSYGSQSLVRPFQTLQNLASARITGAFKGSPSKALELEAGLLPPEVRFNRACLSYSLRTLLFQHTHPVTEAILRPVRDELADSGTDTALRAYIHPNRKIQLQLLASHARELVGRNWNIEKIRTRWAAPWLAKPQATITISTSKKAIAKKEHLSLLAGFGKDPFTSRVALYTDGSQGDPSEVSATGNATTNGAGVCALVSGRIVKTRSWNLGSKVEVADAELFAINRALEFALSFLERDEVYIFCDSQAAIRKVEKGYSYYSLQARSTIRRLASRSLVYLYWVPSHVGVLGNETADRLAKLGLTKNPQPRDIFVSISHLRRLSKAKGPIEWRTLWETEAAREGRARGLGNHFQRVCQGSLNFKPTVYTLALPRRLQSAYTQLKLGIGYLEAYQRLIGNSGDEECKKCCSGKQTTTHLVLKCKAYTQERRDAWKALKGHPPSLRILFCTTIGREALAAFLLSTEICTAKWFQETPG
jgi:ribonuclease HI